MVDLAAVPAKRPEVVTRHPRTGVAALAKRLPPRITLAIILGIVAFGMAAIAYGYWPGIMIDDGPHGATIAIEDSSRVDPWIVRQARRMSAACTERLTEFSRLDRMTSGG